MIEMLNECLREADGESALVPNSSRCVDVQGCPLLHYTDLERCANGCIGWEINESQLSLQINVCRCGYACYMCFCASVLRVHSPPTVPDRVSLPSQQD